MVHTIARLEDGSASSQRHYLYTSTMHLPRTIFLQPCRSQLALHIDGVTVSDAVFALCMFRGLREITDQVRVEVMEGMKAI